MNIQGVPIVRCDILVEDSTGYSKQKSFYCNSPTGLGLNDSMIHESKVDSETKSTYK